jgi:hypothetical protein
MGRVRRIKAGPGTWVGREIKAHSDGRGYYFVVVCVNAKRRTIKLHRLVALAFIGKSSKTVNHKDLNKANNSFTNLEYKTVRGNLAHAFAHGVGAAKLTEKEVLKIRLLARTVSQRKIAKRYNVTYGLISAICLRKCWRHI